MKHIITIIALALATFTSVNVYGQVDYAHPYVSQYAWAFHAGVGELGFMYLETDNHGHTWLKHNVHYIYNAEGLVDSEGKSHLGKYAVNKGKHIYLKLDNDEVITLTCFLMQNVHTDYYVSNVDIHKKYEIYSYFNLDENTIEKLRNHQIVKMRCEMKYEIGDMTCWVLIL